MLSQTLSTDFPVDFRQRRWFNLRLFLLATLCRIAAGLSDSFLPRRRVLPVTLIRAVMGTPGRRRLHCRNSRHAQGRPSNPQKDDSSPNGLRPGDGGAPRRCEQGAGAPGIPTLINERLLKHDVRHLRRTVLDRDCTTPEEARRLGTRAEDIEIPHLPAATRRGADCR